MKMSNDEIRKNILNYMHEKSDRQWTEIDLLIHNDAYEKGWNEAIEASAKILEDILNKGSQYPGRLGPELIRKLKK